MKKLIKLKIFFRRRVIKFYNLIFTIMTGKKKDMTAYEYLVENFEKKVRPTLNIPLLLQYKKALSATFGEENIQITTSYDEYLLYHKPNLDTISLETARELARDLEKNLLFLVYIRFKEVDITNGRKEKRKIEEMFVKIDITKNHTLQNVTGVVSAVTKESFYAGYAHSHISRRSYTSNSTGNIQFSGMCFGSGPISLMLQKRQQLDDPNFRLLIYNIREFVKWESLDGTPYFTLSEVKKTAQNNAGISGRNKINQDWRGSFNSADYTGYVNVPLVKRSYFPEGPIRQSTLVKLAAEHVVKIMKDSPTYFLDKLVLEVDEYEVRVMPEENLDLLVLAALDSMTGNGKPNLSLTDRKIVGLVDRIDEVSVVRSHCNAFDALVGIDGLFNAMEGIFDRYKETKGAEYPPIKSTLIGRKVLTFKGNDILFRVVDNDLKKESENEQKKSQELSEPTDFFKKVEEKTKKFKINKKFTQDVATKLSEIFTRNLEREIQQLKESENGNSTIEITSPALNIREDSVANQVPMSEGVIS